MGKHKWDGIGVRVFSIPASCAEVGRERETPKVTERLIIPFSSLTDELAEEEDDVETLSFQSSS